MGIEVNTDTFEKEVVQSELPVVVDFWGAAVCSLFGFAAPCGGIRGKIWGKVESCKSRCH